ncbi:MAG: hypothetical protein HY901_05740 [Deltaproteobacteria bacterium]|nr:hypothetical protein [Deltaproteobacteria bacterium]
MRTRLLLLAPAIILLLPARSLGAELIGPQSCKVCHPAAYESWKDSQHSHAASSLSPKQRKDARCLSCHSPEQDKGHSDVACESCHGPGQYYSPRYVMKDAELARAVGMVDPSEKACLKCHDANAPSLTPFKFAEKLKLVDHWTAERAARKERASAAASAKPAKEEKAERVDKVDKAAGKTAKGKPEQ